MESVRINIRIDGRMKRDFMKNHLNISDRIRELIVIDTYGYNHENYPTYVDIKPVDKPIQIKVSEVKPMPITIKYERELTREEEIENAFNPPIFASGTEERAGLSELLDKLKTNNNG